MSTATTEARPSTERASGQTVELARYETDRGCQRILLGRRVAGVVRIYDASPGDVTGYRVDEGIQSIGELAALVRDYLAQARRLGAPPMSRTAIRRLVEMAAD